jgi:hypothetical protein
MLALGTQLRTFKINNYDLRIFPSGEVQYLHPKDVFLKSKSGRTAVNSRSFSIGRIQTLLLLNLVELAR